MKIKYLLAFFMVSFTANAQEWKLLDVDSMNIEVARFKCNREPMTPQYNCADYTGRVSANFNLRVAEVAYWDNNVHTEAIESTVKTVGWQYELGLHITKSIDLYWEHHSRHIMEGEQPLHVNERTGVVGRDRFSLEDSFGVRFIFYTNPKPEQSLFD